MTKKIVWRGVIPTTNFCVHNGSSTIRITLNKENVYDETVLLGRFGFVKWFCKNFLLSICRQRIIIRHQLRIKIWRLER